MRLVDGRGEETRGPRAHLSLELQLDALELTRAVRVGVACARGALLPVPVRGDRGQPQAVGVEGRAQPPRLLLVRVRVRARARG